MGLTGLGLRQEFPLWNLIPSIGLALVFVFAEQRLRHLPPARLIGGALGLLGGLLAARLLPAMPPSQDWLTWLLPAALGYVGLMAGADGAEVLRGASAGTAAIPKILDTSVIIDGRIADICEAKFIEGPLVIPQFVLRELQMVADSADSLKRNRGRRGLDILQRLQKMPDLGVQVTDQDFPQVRDVDMKLIELARLLGGKVVTNDFNLNKVAQVRGVAVLNINELANAVRPVVLPGEMMRVFILKEGKEHNQGVAYLDDGTMVVVDNARRQISKTIDVTVTSVLQTTAGKMIFGKYDERQHAVYEPKAAERAAPGA
ncbi:MAG: PIN domain-containing protein [Acidobacteria bacterium]|nr:PIN domain-containing protein [Acidobacteriota bacterium]